MPSDLDALKAACVKVKGPKPGSGYLVAPNRIATCYHVVDQWAEGEAHEVEIGYPDALHSWAKVIAKCQPTDCAVLSVEPPVTVAPLPIASSLEDPTNWQCCGFPHAARGVGIYMKGEVLDPRSKDETGRPILQLSSREAAAGAATPLHGFSGAPVLVDGAVVGHIIRHIGDPDDRKRSAYGLIFAAPIRCVEALLDVEPVRRLIRPAKLVATTDFIDTVRRVPRRDASEDDQLRAARILIGQNRPDLALEVLDAVERSTLEREQTRALALAKASRTDEAIALLEALVSQGHCDKETLGLLAGRHKDRWRDAGDGAALLASHQIYRKAFERTEDAFNGINAAATALFRGDRTGAKALAVRVLESLQGEKGDGDHWSLATIAEAWLLQGRLDDAREFYAKAVARELKLYQDIAVMRRQARLDLDCLGEPRNSLDDVLPVPGVLAFAGHMIDEPGRDPPRFPTEKIGPVRIAIRETLQALGFVQGFGTSAKGSDIIFLQEMVRRKVKPIVVMPFPEEDFRQVSVGKAWGGKLDAIRDQLEVVVLESEAPQEHLLPETFSKSNERIFRLAVEHARRLDETPRLLVVWDRKVEGDGPGGTADVVRQWSEEGYQPIVIDITAL